MHVHLRACAFAFTRTLSVLSQMIGARTIAGPRLHALMHRPASLYTWTHTHELRERERERERERGENFQIADLPSHPHTYLPTHIHTHAQNEVMYSPVSYARGWPVAHGIVIAKGEHGIACREVA